MSLKRCSLPSLLLFSKMAITNDAQNINNSTKSIGDPHANEVTSEKETPTNNQDEIGPKQQRIGAKPAEKPFQICFGKTRDAFSTDGNKRFRALVSSYALEYNQSTERNFRSMVVNKLMEHILQLGGTFLRRVDGNWESVRCLKLIKSKIGHSLRDAAAAMISREIKKQNGTFRKRSNHPIGIQPPKRISPASGALLRNLSSNTTRGSIHRCPKIKQGSPPNAPAHSSPVAYPRPGEGTKTPNVRVAGTDNMFPQKIMDSSTKEDYKVDRFKETQAVRSMRAFTRNGLTPSYLESRTVVGENGSHRIQVMVSSETQNINNVSEGPDSMPMYFPGTKVKLSTLVPVDTPFPEPVVIFCGDEGGSEK